MFLTSNDSLLDFCQAYTTELEEEVAKLKEENQVLRKRQVCLYIHFLLPVCCVHLHPYFACIFLLQKLRCGNNHQLHFIAGGNSRDAEKSGTL